MSRILKSINFLSNHSVTLEASGFATSLVAQLNPDKSLVEVTTSDPNQNEASISDTTSTDLLQEAQQHVEMMLSQAQVQVTTWQEEARQAGWEAGYSEARQAVEAELTEAVISTRRLAESAVEAHDQFLHNNQVEIGKLAVAIAEKIIGKELALNPKTITDIVATAIRTANIRGACRIRVNPIDYEIIEPYWNAVPSLQPSGQTWELVHDARIRQGGCLIEVGGGTIDAQLETQLEQVTIALQS